LRKCIFIEIFFYKTAILKHVRRAKRGKICYLKLGNRAQRVKISPPIFFFGPKRLWGSFMFVQKLLKMEKFYKIDSKKIYWRKVYKFTPQRAYRPWVTPGLKPSQTEIKFTTQPNFIAGLSIGPKPKINFFKMHFLKRCLNIKNFFFDKIYLFLCPTNDSALYGWIWRIYSVSARPNCQIIWKK
jgi:hypothetical protein